MYWLKNYQARTQLGQILVKKNLISAEQLAKAIDHQARTGKRLGDILAEWGVITQQHVTAALRTQRNFRLAAAMAAALLAPLQTHAVTPVASAYLAQRLTEQSKQSNLVPLTDEDLDGISAQGLDRTLLELISRHAKGNDGKVVLGDLAKLMVPVLGFLDADKSMKDVVYDAEKASAVVHPDGSITLRLPSSIGELTFNNIRPRGADGPSFGSVTLSRIEFNNSTITLYRH